MKGQLSLFQNMVYPYWEYKHKAQPDSIHTPKCIRVFLSASHVYWYCPTCRCDSTIYKIRKGYGRTEEIADRCDWCGQKIYYDDVEIESEPYFKEMLKKRDLIIQKERNSAFVKKKKVLKEQLSQGIICQEEYKNLLHVEELMLLGKYTEAEQLRKKLKNEQWRKNNTPYMV